MYPSIFCTKETILALVVRPAHVQSKKVKTSELDVGGGKTLSIKSVASITDPINNRFK